MFLDIKGLLVFVFASDIFCDRISQISTINLDHLLLVQFCSLTMGFLYKNVFFYSKFKDLLLYTAQPRVKYKSVNKD